MTGDIGKQLNLELLQHTLGPISQYLDDSRVTDIHIYKSDDVWVKRQGEKIRKVDSTWHSDADLMIAAEAMAEHINRRLDKDHPILDSRLPDGSRVNIIIPPCYSAGGACISIRMFPKERFGVNDLVRFRTIDQNGVDILSSIVLLGKNVLISGSTGSGKTTLLNVLCSFIPETDIVVTVEDSREINISNPLWAPLESKHALHTDDRAVTLQDLVRNSLRMNPKWVIVGEVRGAESLDLIRAFNTGHSGLSTIHANTCYDALLALENLALQSGLDISARAVKEMVSRAISIMIQVSQFPDETRKIVDISEVLGLDYEASSVFPPYKIVPLYRFNMTGYEKDRVIGSFEVVNIPSFLTETMMFHEKLNLPNQWLGGF